MTQLCEARIHPIAKEKRLLLGFSALSWTATALSWQALKSLLRVAMRTFLYVVGLLAALLPGADTHAQGIDAKSIQLYLEKESIGVNGRVEVTMGEIDPRLHLAPCARIEPFVPRGSRLWGRSNIGVRCVEGASWSTFIPVNIRVYAPAVIAARPLKAGQEVALEDLRLEEVELTREPPGVFTDPNQLIDRILLRTVNVGQVLRADQTRARPVLNAGDQVKVSYRGPGFAVSVEGRALSQAVDGQNVRVQTDAGKILNGVARPGRIVEIRS